MMNRTTITRTSLSVVAFVALMGLGFSLYIPYANALNKTNTDPNILKGSITSIQDDNPGDNTQWIIGGVYRMENRNSTSPTFNASFYMMKTDGTASHTHDVYDFVMSGQPVSNGSSTVYKGTATVTMREGPVSQVPTTITVFDDSAISIVFDPSKTNNHFGSTPIYGTQNQVCVESPQYCK